VLENLISQFLFNKAAEGKDNKQIASLLHTRHVTVGQWRQRVLDLGLTGLQ
jgi:DNA-binding NarL/FixJ family response regulator